MSQEDKFKEAQRLYETANADQRYVLERLFPELKESEDEKILRHLKAVVKAYDMWTERGLSMNDVLTWLEKQGADKPYYTDLLGYFEAGKRLNHSVEEIRGWLKSKI